MKQLHFPLDTRTFSKGANYDINKEFLIGDKGTYIDACNMRPSDMSKDNGALKKIKGETLKWNRYATGQCPNAGFYIYNMTTSHFCIGTQEINDNVIEFWVHPSPNQQLNSQGDFIYPETMPCIRINGDIVLQSFKLPFTYPNSLQIDKNESCAGGEIYVTDNIVPPMFFNIEDMMTHAGMLSVPPHCDDKYFQSYDPEANVLSIKNSLNAPRYDGTTTSNGSWNSSDIVAMNAGNGLDIGVYAYAVRFVDDSGNRTEISEFTPTIPAYAKISSLTSVHPWCYTYGGDTGDTTPMGFQLAIRADGSGQYKECEVVRLTWASGDALGATPEGFVVIRFDLAPDTIKTYYVVDRSPETLEPVGEEPATLLINAVNRAKAIRFFNNRLYLMNVSLSGKDIDDLNIGADPSEPTKVNGDSFMWCMETQGHNDPNLFTYHKGYMPSERYGFGVVFRDANGSKTFTQQLKFDQGSGLKPYYEFPRRREPMSQEGIDLSILGASFAAEGSFTPPATESYTAAYCHEPFALYHPQRRTALCGWIQFLDKGGKKATRIIGSCGLSNVNTYIVEWGRCFDGGVDSDGHSTYYAGSECDFGALDTKHFFRYVKPMNLSDSAAANTTGGHFWQPLKQGYITKNAYVPFYQDDKPSSDGVSLGRWGWYNWMFSPDYYSMALAIEKIEYPSWATSFSIVRTEPAYKVRSQGLCFYDINSAHKQQTSANKNYNSVIFWSPDFDTNFGVLSDFATDVELQPQKYTLVLESALGFNTEIYCGNRNPTGKDKRFEMMSFCNMLRDQDGNTGDWDNTRYFYLVGQNNVGGAATPDGYKYVIFGRWRNDATHAGNPLTNNQREFPIIGFQYIGGEGTRAGSRGGHHWKLTIQTSYFYKNRYVGNEHRYNQDRVRYFHEPVYIGSVVDKNLEPPQGQNVEYTTTGHIQQIKSGFYLSKGNPFSQQLVDERWEDCIPDLRSKHGGVDIDGVRYAQDQRIGGMSTDYWAYHRFVYVDDGTGEKPWVNVVQKDAAFILTMQVQLILNGYVDMFDASSPNPVRVYGMYSSTQDGQYMNNQRFFLEFNEDVFLNKGIGAGVIDTKFYVPSEGAIIYIRYDDRFPLRIFGGDAFMGEQLMDICDLEVGDNGKPKDDANTFEMNIGMPYHQYILNERNIIVEKTSGGNKIQDSNKLKFDNHAGNSQARITQWLAMFVAMARTPIHSQYMKPEYLDSQNQFYPLKHWTPRPMEWKNNDLTKNLKSEYVPTFGEEYNWWAWGGFRFMPTVNHDYAQRNNYQEYTAKPVAFVEETDFCTRILWSEPKPTNIVDSPNVRTFPVLNFFDISDDTGEIKYSFDSEGNKGENLYAITASGVCLLITNKRLLSEISGQQLATIGSEDIGVQRQLWLNKKIGMPDEMWRSAAESSTSLFWANHDSAFKLMIDQIIDIGRIKYHSRLSPRLKLVLGDYDSRLTATYNELHKEYWIQILELGEGGRGKKYTDTPTLVFSEITQHWLGGFGFVYDKYLCMDDATLYGMIGAETFLLNKGDAIRDSNVKAYVITASSPKQPKDKEFCRIRINSVQKPTRVDFYTELAQYEANTSIAELDTLTNPLALKNYWGWEQFIPRRSDNSNRLQGRMMLYKITHDVLDEDYVLTDTQVQFKGLA